MSFARTWIPNQHGAWAMLITPVVVGALLGGVTAWHPLLLLAWLSAYCLNFFTGLAVKSRRPRRYARQLTTYALLAALLGGPVLVSHPDLLILGVVAVPVFLANLWFITRRNERAWLNDVLGIVLAAFVGFGAYLLGVDAGHRDAALAAGALAVVTAYFIGTVFYVKTMIRERGDARWLAVSIGYHAALVLILVVAEWWFLAAVAGAALIRAIVVPRFSWSPKRVGLVEVVFTLGFGLGVLLR